MLCCFHFLPQLMWRMQARVTWRSALPPAAETTYQTKWSRREQSDSRCPTRLWKVVLTGLTSRSTINTLQVCHVQQTRMSGFCTMDLHAESRVSEIRISEVWLNKGPPHNYYICKKIIILPTSSSCTLYILWASPPTLIKFNWLKSSLRHLFCRRILLIIVNIIFAS